MLSFEEEFNIAFKDDPPGLVRFLIDQYKAGEMELVNVMDVRFLRVPEKYRRRFLTAEERGSEMDTIFSEMLEEVGAPIDPNILCYARDFTTISAPFGDFRYDLIKRLAEFEMQLEKEEQHKIIPFPKENK